MKRKFFIVAAVLMSSTLQAQQDSVQNLNEVVLTATKFPTIQSGTGKVISVISKEVIDKSQGKTISQLLNEQAGIIVNGATNTVGSPQSLYLRGGAVGRTLILLDGVPVSDPSLINNEFDFNLISLNDVDRIEVCKGAQSTLYGSDAVGGVINIITNGKASSKKFNIEQTVAGGNLNTFKAYTKLLGSINKLSYNIRYARNYTGGFSSAVDKTGAGNFDRDSYNGNALTASVKYEFSNLFSAKAFYQSGKYITDFDAGAFSDSKDRTSDNKSNMAGISIEYKTDNIQLQALYRHAEVKRELFDDSTDAPGYLTRDNYNGKSDFIDLFANIKINKQFSWLQGIDHRSYSMKAVSFGTYPASPWGPAGTYGSTTDSSINQASVYAVLIYKALQEKLHLDAGTRLNLNSRFGNNQTYSFSGTYNINNTVRVLANISSGYKIPTIYQLFSEYGNTALKVESSTTYELGVQLNKKNFAGRLVYYHRNIKSGIDFDYINYKYYNFNQQNAGGIEYEMTIKPLKDLSIAANYTYLHIKESSQSRVNMKDTSYKYGLRRPEHSCNITVSYSGISRLFLSVGGKYIGARYDVGGYMANDVKLKEYLVVNAYASYTLRKHVSFFTDLQNAGNTTYYELNGYNSIPLLFTGGVIVKL